MPRSNRATPSYKWGDQLILFRYLLGLFGKDSLTALAEMGLNHSEYEGMNENQQTHFWVALDGIIERQGENPKISRDVLREYDERICQYVKKIGENRGGINLKYFQYIACLFTEIYLDRYFSDKSSFADDLNVFIENVKYESNDEIDIELFSPANMNKLAFMCATGSGKTLIMHINILQFKFYLEKAKQLDPHIDINSIIVLTPNEGMSTQHLSELKLSGISAEPFTKSGFGSGTDVIVIDMHKFDEEGKVKTVSIDSFEQNNLVLVDEAHRGLGGDKWYDYRSRLSAEGGFAFEYSATLKQAMKSSKPSNITQSDWETRLDEYYRSIIVDYSYKYFYGDGYGKEYRIFNLRENIDEEQRHIYLTGCLLSFYQQLKLFEEKKRDFAPYNIEKPLLVFVGNRVTAKTSVAEMTDVEAVLVFIDTFVNKKDKTIKRIEAILSDDTGLTDTDGREFFSQNFMTLKALFGGEPKAEDIFRDIMRVVFNSNIVTEEPRLHMLNLRQVQGEIALRIGSDGETFGVISIGDGAKLIKNCNEKGIVTDTDAFSDESLFLGINDHNSNIKVLIGSRKFTEGWNSWRVSTMGLINFAQGEGSQAIQLFGRGVRLRGYGGRLKRSHRLDDRSVVPPRNIELLETLTIFGIKAQYMEDFRRYLEKEEISANEKSHIYKLTVISRYNDVKDKELRVIKLKSDADFMTQSAHVILCSPDDGFARYLNKNRVVIDCRSKVQAIESTSSRQLEREIEEHRIDERFIDFLDFERVFNELELYKANKGLYNISLHKENLRDILQKDWYSLIIPKSYINIDTMSKLLLNTDFAIMLLKNYIDKFQKYEKDRWEAPRLEYQALGVDDASFVSEYTFTYNETHGEVSHADTIKEFVMELQTLLNQERGIPGYSKSRLNNAVVGYDSKVHLYTPLIRLKETGLNLTVIPVSLNHGEEQFVNRIDNYVDSNPEILADKSLYLLRNKSKVGMGFFEADNFHPDFVLWIDSHDTQYISFVDPKGLQRLSWTDPKIEFYDTIKRIEERLQPSSGGKRIVLNSFILSDTNAETLRHWWEKDESERHAKNVFCLEEHNCIELMITKILSSC